MSLRFDFVDLQLFIHVVETGNMGRGAERCFLSPPAATKRIKLLEDALGVKLLYRSSQGISPTPAGEVFARHARVLFANIGHMNDELQAYAAGVKGHVRLWTNTTAVNEFLPELLTRFMVGRPHVNVELRERLSHEIVKAVEEGMADIGIVAGHVSTDNLEVLPFRDYELVVILPRNHPLAGLDTVSFESTLKYDYIALSEASAIRKFLVNAAEALGARLKNRVEVGSFESICRLVEAGIGISVVPKSIAVRIAGTLRLAIIPLEEEWARRRLRICVRRLDELPSFGRDLVDVLVEQAPAH